MKAIEQHCLRVCLSVLNISQKEHCFLLNLERMTLKLLSDNEQEPSGHLPSFGPLVVFEPDIKRICHYTLFKETLLVFYQLTFVLSIHNIHARQMPFILKCFH